MLRPTLLSTAAVFALGLNSFAESAPDTFIAEDFESTAAGAIPTGFTKTGAIAVADDAAHSGKHSLKIEPAVKGGRYISLPKEKVATFGGSFWGRLYFKVKQPAPLPVVPEGKTSSIIHTTLVAGKAVSPLANDPIELRMLGTITSMKGTFKYLYNVQPKGGRKEFGVTSKSSASYTDEWTLAEWFVDNATQTYQLFINGQEVSDVALHKGAGQYEGVEAPSVYESLSFGWTNYQAATGEGFTVWIDDLALGKKRLGPVAGDAK